MNLKLPLLLGCCLFAAITACAETSASLDENAAGKKKAEETEFIPYRYSSEKSGKSASDESFFRITADSGYDLHAVYLCELFKAPVFRDGETESH